MAADQRKNTYRQEVIKLSKKIGNDDLETIKYYFEDDLPKAELENINKAIPLIKMLEEHGKIKNGDIEGLNRLIFHEILQREDDPQRKEITKLDREFDVFLQHVSDRIAAIWERLGRFLSVPSEEIDNIASDQIKYFGVKKKALSMLRHAKNSYEGLTWQRLRKGLADCNRWDVIRDIESNQKFKPIVSGSSMVGGIGTQASSDIQARDKNMVLNP